ncbi:DUF6165 family protein [Aestuariispira ectoiniformans]|uniref:DUF6165 family protein n=1 Tax=Aestuariispira ectoiniformans TaxID=2775080 RepID=UPI00223BDC21|nr:DUF6165 family protein [Aestuariispira ectoiniformans]
MSVTVPVSWGELIDKITILEIKLAKLQDEAALCNVRKEYEALCAVRDEASSQQEELSGLAAELLDINQTLWTIEDDIRDCERDGEFGDRFVRLARSVYHTNDRRAAVKRRINEVMQSEFFEEKSYASY